MQSRKRVRCLWCRTLYQLLRCSSGGGFCPSGRKIRFPARVTAISPNGKAQHIKGFLNRFARRRKDGGFPQPYGEAGYANGKASTRRWYFVIAMNIKLALGEERGEFNVLLANEWLASAMQPVATVSGESWYFFGHCAEVTALPGAPAQWAAIFARFGAKLENVSVGCCGMAGTYGHEAKNHKIRSGSMNYPASGYAATAA